MTTAHQEAHHLAMATAARALLAEANSAAGECPPDSADRRFYHGVEAAALDVLHPERTAVRDGPAWLDAEGPAFRAGFLEATTLLSGAAAARDLRTHIPLPRPTRPD